MTTATLWMLPDVFWYIFTHCMCPIYTATKDVSAQEKDFFDCVRNLIDISKHYLPAVSKRSDNTGG